MKPGFSEGSRRGRRIVGLVLIVQILLIAALGGNLVWSALQVEQLGCSDPTHQYLPDFRFLLIAFAALLGGRLFGYIRYEREWSTRADHIFVAAAGHLALGILFIAITAALVYESIGVDAATPAGKPSLEPITYYVRCAIYFDKTSGAFGGVRTLGTLILVCGLLGHWLWPWHPQEKRIGTDARVSEESLK